MPRAPGTATEACPLGSSNKFGLSGTSGEGRNRGVAGRKSDQLSDRVSLRSGMVMQRGPPKPRTSSEPSMQMQ